MAGRYMLCPTCKGEISAEAAACPKCGHAFRSPGGLNMKDPVHLLGVVLVILFAIGVVMTVLSQV